MSLFRTVLVAADFSETSRQAFRLAGSLSRDDRTRLIVLHVIEPPIVSEELVYFASTSLLAGETRLEPRGPERRLRGAYVPDRPLEVAYPLRDATPRRRSSAPAEELGCALDRDGHPRADRTGPAAVRQRRRAVLRKAHCPVLALRSPSHLTATLERGRGATIPAYISPVPVRQPNPLRPRSRRRSSFPSGPSSTRPISPTRSEAALPVARAWPATRVPA